MEKLKKTLDAEKSQMSNQIVEMKQKYGTQVREYDSVLSHGKHIGQSQNLFSPSRN